MRKKNKGVWVSVRLLTKHSRTSEGSKEKYTCAGKRIGGNHKKRWRKDTIHRRRSRPKGPALGGHGARYAAGRPPSWKKVKRMLTVVDHIIL